MNTSLRKLMRQKFLLESLGAGSKTLSNNSMQLNVGNDIKSVFRLDQPVSAPGLTSPLEKDIRALEKLSLSQPQGQPTPSPSSNLQKRVSANDETLSDVELKPQEIPMKLLISSDMSDSLTDSTPEMLLQLETQLISHVQLAVEVKGIYAGLVMVEAKCVDVDEKQSIAAQEKDPAQQTKLSNEQWQALIALHRTLLHEHYDFFLASQHPSAGPALTHLAAQYSMPARMRRYRIHSFLEVLRHRLPESLDHMLAFIYIAYSMMMLLYETVTAFEDT